MCFFNPSGEVGIREEQADQSEREKREDGWGRGERLKKVNLNTLMAQIGKCLVSFSGVNHYISQEGTGT